MVKLHDGGVYLVNGETLVPETEAAKVEQMTGKAVAKEEAKKGTIAYGIMKAHNQSESMDKLQIKFDAMVSHDITFVGIIQTARASGMEKFPLPYVLTCCHNSLCAVGGTINDDDHYFGLSAAKKYGGLFVPPHVAVCHQYMRECFAGGGKMILGSDSHTRYGALGTMAMGEGGGELVKQLLSQTYDINMPGVVAIYLKGQPRPGVGPQDVALAIIGKVFANGYVKNKVMEFVGPGVAGLSADFRIGIDVMTTETTCLTSIWRTDEDTRNYLAKHHREEDYRKLDPADIAYYDGCVYVDLSKVKPMIALPFHPSNAYTIREFLANAKELLAGVEAEAKKRWPLLDTVKQHLCSYCPLFGNIAIRRCCIYSCCCCFCSVWYIWFCCFICDASIELLMMQEVRFENFWMAILCPELNVPKPVIGIAFSMMSMKWRLFSPPMQRARSRQRSSYRTSFRMYHIRLKRRYLL